MAFWKKSEDPWDIDPTKRKKESVSVFEQEPERECEQKPEGLFGGMFKKKEEVVEEPPACPWCGRKMARGYLLGGRDKLRLSDRKPTAFLGSLGYDTLEINDEGFLVTYKSCWQCMACRKLVADIPEPDPIQDGFAWDGNPVCPPTPKEIEKQK